MDEADLEEELSATRAELASVRREALHDFEELRLGYERQLDAQLDVIGILRTATSSAWAGAVAAATAASRAELAAARAVLLRQQRESADEREAAGRRLAEVKIELQATRSRVRELEAEQRAALAATTIVCERCRARDSAGQAKQRQQSPEQQQGQEREQQQEEQHERCNAGTSASSSAHTPPRSTHSNGAPQQLIPQAALRSAPRSVQQPATKARQRQEPGPGPGRARHARVREPVQQHPLQRQRRQRRQRQQRNHARDRDSASGVASFGALPQIHAGGGRMQSDGAMRFVPPQQQK